MNNKHKSSLAHLILISSEFSLPDLLPFITVHKAKKEYTVEQKKYTVKMNSDRYHTFCKSTACIVCGLDGTVLLLEREKFHSNNIGHFNLYGRELGKLIIMTKDHIIPKSKGGKNHITNYQTMCQLCNSSKKDNSNIRVEEILQKRIIITGE